MLTKFYKKISKGLKKESCRLLLSWIGDDIENQEILEKFLHLNLEHMNIGCGENVASSGEEFVLKYVKNKSTSQLEPITIFDVGAKIGNYSLLILNIFKNENINLFSFEPCKSAYHELETNLKDHQDVKLYNIGLSNENARKKLFYDSDKSVLASLHNRNLAHWNIDFNMSEEVDLITLDNFCIENNIKKIDFLKLDVEGHEFKILEGAKNLISNNRIRFIQFEFGGCNIDSRTYFQDYYYLLKERYNLYRIAKKGLYPIKNYKELYDIFLVTNFFAESKYLDE